MAKLCSVPTRVILTENVKDLEMLITCTVFYVSFRESSFSPLFDKCFHALAFLKTFLSSVEFFVFFNPFIIHHSPVCCHYREIYRAGYFVFRIQWRPLSSFPSVSIDTSETMKPTNMYYLSLESSFDSASVHF